MGLPSVCAWPCFPLLWQSLDFILSKLQQKGRGNRREHQWKKILLFPLSYKVSWQQQPLLWVCFTVLSIQMMFGSIRAHGRETRTPAPRNVPVAQLSLSIRVICDGKCASHRAPASQLKGLGVQWPGESGGRRASCSL